MKKFLLFVFAFVLTVSVVKADTFYVESNLNMDNFWEKTGKENQKVFSVQRKLIHANNLKRAPLTVERNLKSKNAHTNKYSKEITVSTGLLQYIDNDDELAFILAHELAHAQDAYGGTIKMMAMSCNSKKYEYKADLKAVDYMVKAGYNPISAIIIADKIFAEPQWDWSWRSSHPKGSNRMIELYKYIYKKYPAYLSSQMTKNIVYVDFLRQYEKELSHFKQKYNAKNNIDSESL